MALTTGYAALYIAMLLVVAVVHLLAPRLQVDGRVTTLAGTARRVVAAGRAAARRRGAAAGRARARVSAARRRGRGRRCTSRRATRRPAATAAYNALAADLYWIRAIQYYGGAKRVEPSGTSRRNRRRCSPQPTRTSTSCCIRCSTSPPRSIPRFNIAYRFGAIFLAEPYPAGAGRPDLAIALLEKGLRDRPDKWEYMQDIGFVHYWCATTTGRRPAWFDKASEVPGAPVVAASRWRRRRWRRAAIGGRRGTMWEAIRAVGRDRLAAPATPSGGCCSCSALDEIDALQAAVDDSRDARGSPPADWAALVARGRASGVPVDPSRHAVRADADGRVRLSQSSSLFPLPDRTAAAGAAPS